MTKSKLWASFIVVPSIFLTHLVNGIYFLNATYFAWYSITAISPFTKMWRSLQSQRLDFNFKGNFICGIIICLWIITDNAPFSCNKFRIVFFIQWIWYFLMSHYLHYSVTINESKEILKRIFCYFSAIKNTVPPSSSSNFLVKSVSSGKLVFVCLDKCILMSSQQFWWHK